MSTDEGTLREASSLMIRLMELGAVWVKSFGRWTAMRVAKWGPWFTGFQRDEKGWDDYRFVPNTTKQRFVAPWEPVFILAASVASAIMLNSGSYSWPTWACLGGLLLVAGIVARRSVSLCMACLGLGYDLKRFAVYLRRQVPIWAEFALRQIASLLRYVGKQSWLFGWWFIGFRRRKDGRGSYRYLQRAGSTDRVIFAPWELIMAIGSVVWARLSIEIGVLANLGWPKPIEGLFLRCIPATCFVMVVAHRKHLRRQRGLEQRRRQSREVIGQEKKLSSQAIFDADSVFSDQ